MKRIISSILSLVLFLLLFSVIAFADTNFTIADLQKAVTEFKKGAIIQEVKNDSEIIFSDGHNIAGIADLNGNIQEITYKFEINNSLYSTCKKMTLGTLKSDISNYGNVPIGKLNMEIEYLNISYLISGLERRKIVEFYGLEPVFASWNQPQESNGWIYSSALEEGDKNGTYTLTITKSLTPLNQSKLNDETSGADDEEIKKDEYTKVELNSYKGIYVNVPKTPFYASNGYGGKVRIDDITLRINLNTYYYEILAEGEVISDMSQIEFKIYDETDTVVAKMYLSTNGAEQGDKFRVSKYLSWPEPNHTYTMKAAK